MWRTNILFFKVTYWNRISLLGKRTSIIVKKNLTLIKNKPVYNESCKIPQVTLQKTKTNYKNTNIFRHALPENSEFFVKNETRFLEAVKEFSTSLETVHIQDSRLYVGLISWTIVKTNHFTWAPGYTLLSGGPFLYASGGSWRTVGKI